MRHANQTTISKTVCSVTVMSAPAFLGPHFGIDWSCYPRALLQPRFSPPFSPAAAPSERAPTAILWYVKVHFQTQSMSQMRTAQVLNSSNPPDCAPAVMPTCNSGPDLSCPVAQFKAIVLAAIRSECLV